MRTSCCRRLRRRRRREPRRRWCGGEEKISFFPNDDDYDDDVNDRKQFLGKNIGKNCRQVMSSFVVVVTRSWRGPPPPPCHRVKFWVTRKAKDSPSCLTSSHHLHPPFFPIDQSNSDLGMKSASSLYRQSVGQKRKMQKYFLDRCNLWLSTGWQNLAAFRRG